MRSIVRFNAQRLSNSIKSGGFNIGVDNKSANLTGFFNGISPIIGGYVIYINKASGGPSIFTPKNDTDLINITKTLGGNVSTASDALVWLNSQTNMTVVNTNYPPIVTEGLVLNLDAGLVSSYPKTGTTWRDLSGGNNNSSLFNGVSFNDGSMVFDGVDDYGTIPNITTSRNCSICFWFKDNNPGAWTNIFAFNTGDNNTSSRVEKHGTQQSYYWFGSGGFNPGSLLFNHNGSKFDYICLIFSQNFATSYLNSNSVTQNPSSNFSPASFINIGRRINSQNWRGSISQFSVYNRALTPQEIQQNYLSGLQRFIPTNDLVLSLNAQNTNLYATSPTTIYDVSGNDNNGTMLNGVQFIGDSGGCWNFDGVNDRCALLSNTTYGDNTTWTVWINRTSSVNALNMFMGRFLPYFAARPGTTGFHFSNRISGTQRNLYTTGISVEDNVWYHLSFTTEFNGTNTIMRIYVNGVLNSSGTFPGQQSQTSQPFNIGDGQNSTWYPFKGKINDVKVYNRTLTSDEISTIYNATKSRYGI